MSEPRDYWLSLAVYDEFRSVPVRKAVARSYVDLSGLTRDQATLYIRLGSLFFQGRSWVKLLGDDGSREAYAEQLTDADRAELESFRTLRTEIGAAVLQLLDDEDHLDPLVKEATLERMESGGFLDS